MQQTCSCNASPDRPPAALPFVVPVRPSYSSPNRLARPIPLLRLLLTSVTPIDQSLYDVFVGLACLKENLSRTQLSIVTLNLKDIELKKFVF